MTGWSAGSERHQAHSGPVRGPPRPQPPAPPAPCLPCLPCQGNALQQGGRLQFQATGLGLGAPGGRGVGGEVGAALCFAYLYIPPDQRGRAREPQTPQSQNEIFQIAPKRGSRRRFVPEEAATLLRVRPSPRLHSVVCACVAAIGRTK